MRNLIKPLLFVDIDGVLSIYGFDAHSPADDSWCLVDGMMHRIADGSGMRLQRLAGHFELVWATGWGDRANDHLVALLGLPRVLPVVEFAVQPTSDGSGHWKLDALDDFQPSRAAAWIDDGHNEACHEWALRRTAPTLLVSTNPHVGMNDHHVDELIKWAISPVRTSGAVQ